MRGSLPVAAGRDRRGGRAQVRTDQGETPGGGRGRNWLCVRDLSLMCALV